ncbi:unnamed protein product [Ambrosiozyma monospora]|uniref:Unnamed protein product n=1 Tax=Ambrosiozyma monospora TaxID=43982 RepID=A0A9W6YW72_AMBMO|nr:unnamed protein product [Ambrosiozyma monospora]
MQGLVMVFVEDAPDIRKNQFLTDNWKDICEASDTPYVGNAANNTVNFYDLTGESVQVKELPSGFTARGIVAMVFSCIAGFLGCVMIGIYGMADIPNIEQQVADDFALESTELLADTDDEYHTGATNVENVENGHNKDSSSASDSSPDRVRSN